MENQVMEQKTEMTEVELEQMFIRIIQAENDHLIRRIYGMVRKELELLEKRMKGIGV